MLSDVTLISLLYQVMTRNNLKLKQVADDLDVEPESISRWRKNGKMSRSNRDSVAVWLASRGVDLSREDIIPIPTPRKTYSDEVSFDVPPGISVPLLTVAQAAEICTCNPFGDPLMNIKDGAQSYFTNPNPGDFAVIISGNSMMPWYPPGTQVLVGRNEIPRNGDRVIAMLADREVPVFKVFVDFGEEFALVSLNDKEGIPTVQLNKMDRSEYYWCWPVKESKRMERDVDNAIREYGMSYPWDDKIKKLLDSRKHNHDETEA